MWTQGLFLDMNTCYGFTCPRRFWNPLGPYRDAEKALMEMVSRFGEALDITFWSSCPLADSESRSMLWPLDYAGEETQYG